MVFFILFRHNQHEDLEMDLEFERREQSSPTTKRTKHTGDPEPDSQP